MTRPSCLLSKAVLSTINKSTLYNACFDIKCKYFWYENEDPNVTPPIGCRLEEFKKRDKDRESIIRKGTQ
jgi:hypothetical protein